MIILDELFSCDGVADEISRGSGGSFFTLENPSVVSAWSTDLKGYVSLFVINEVSNLYFQFRILRNKNHIIWSTVKAKLESLVYRLSLKNSLPSYVGCWRRSCKCFLPSCTYPSSSWIFCSSYFPYFSSCSFWFPSSFYP